MFEVLAMSTVRSRERLARARVDEARKIVEHVGHLVAALTATYVHDDIGIAPLRDLLQEHRLAGPETAGNGRGAPPRNRVQQVEHALPRGERLGLVEAGAKRPPLAHRPQLHERDLVAGHDRDRLVVVVPAGRRDRVDAAADPWGDEQPVLESGALDHDAEYVAIGDGVADGDSRPELPLPVGGSGHAARTQERFGRDEWSQQAVEDAAEQTGAEPGRQRVVQVASRRARGEAARVLVDLRGRALAPHPDDFARQAQVADLHEIEQRDAVESVDLHERAVDTRDAGGAGAHVSNSSIGLPRSANARRASAGSV